ncbi:MAG: HAMP domain-containing sensor histidine kinase [Cyanobacteriota bacterium]
MSETENNCKLNANNDISDINYLTMLDPELRTPLHAILGFSELLEKEYFGKLNEKQMEYIQLISKSGKHILTLMNNVLDIIKIETDDLELKCEEFCPEKAIEEVIAFFDIDFKSNSISLIYNIDQEIKTIFGDRQRFKQILHNLLINALKLTPEGGKIDVHILKDSDNTAKISVIDDGIGIEEKELEKLFPELNQLNKERTPIGININLTLAKRLVEMQDGKMGVESKLGKGSEFWFILPISPD